SAVINEELSPVLLDQMRVLELKKEWIDPLEIVSPCLANDQHSIPRSNDRERSADINEHSWVGGEDRLCVCHAQLDPTIAVQAERSLDVVNIGDLRRITVDGLALDVNNRRDVYTDVGPEARPHFVTPDFTRVARFRHGRSSACGGGLVIAMVISRKG